MRALWQHNNGEYYSLRSKFRRHCETVAREHNRLNRCPYCAKFVVGVTDTDTRASVRSLDTFNLLLHHVELSDHNSIDGEYEWQDRNEHITLPNELKVPARQHDASITEVGPFEQIWRQDSQAETGVGALVSTITKPKPKREPSDVTKPGSHGVQCLRRPYRILMRACYTTPGQGASDEIWKSVPR